MLLSHKVVAARKKKGLTQEELAERAQLTVRTIQRIENGETTPRAFTLKALSTALEIPFDMLQEAEEPAEEATHKTTPVETAHGSSETDHFLQLLCLSCFSYLVIPFVHFLVPLYLLKKRKEQNPRVLEFARKVIRTQVYWMVALHLLLLLTLTYNLFVSLYPDATYRISYLLPFFSMYGLNALMIVADLARGRNKSRSTAWGYVADNQ